MKTPVTYIALLMILGQAGSAQTTFGVRAGYGFSVNPKTNFLIANSSDPEGEFLFNVEHVSFSPTIGTLMRYEGPHFWIMAEALYHQRTTAYSVTPTFPPEELLTRQVPFSTTYTEKTGVIEIPVSAGVRLGKVDIFSGLYAQLEVKSEIQQPTLTEISRASPTPQFGWQSGVGLNFGHFLVDVRYQHAFANYGQGLSVAGEELILKNALHHLTASIAYRF